MTNEQSQDGASFDLSEAELAALGRRTLDLIERSLGAEREEPILGRASGASVRAMVDGPLPAKGTPASELFDEIEKVILPHCRRNGHRRFFGYVASSADPLGILADAIASALNQNVTAWRSAPIATEIERLVLRWLDELIGFGGGGSGVLVSGGSAANTAALACALGEAAGAGESGAVSRERMTVYVSSEGHLSLRKAARILGVRAEHVRLIGVDGEYRMVAEELERALAADTSEGLRPACVCASAGTTNTGAVDPLVEIGEVCRRQGVWMHIDGAYGAPAAATEGYGWMREAFARADSITLDPHKWLFAPFDVGCVLVRDAAAARRMFAEPSEYTEVTQSDPIESHAFFDCGPELSRRFRALKVWMILKGRGASGLARVIARNIEQREHLDRLIEREQCLEAMGSGLSVSCFRYLPGGDRTETELNELNRRILERVVWEGRSFMSPTVLGGRYALRVCIVNFRTTLCDVDGLIDEIIRVGGELA